MSVAAMGFSPLHRPLFMSGSVALGRVRFLGHADAAHAQIVSQDERNESERHVKIRKAVTRKDGM